MNRIKVSRQQQAEAERSDKAIELNLRELGFWKPEP